MATDKMKAAREAIAHLRDVAGLVHDVTRNDYCSWVNAVEAGIEAATAEPAAESGPSDAEIERSIRLRLEACANCGECGHTGDDSLVERFDSVMRRSRAAPVQQSDGICAVCDVELCRHTGAGHEFVSAAAPQPVVEALRGLAEAVETSEPDERERIEEALRAAKEVLRG